MKKAIKVIALVAVLAIIGVVLFACAPGDLDKAKSKMDKAGYEAETYKLTDKEIDAMKAADKYDGQVGYIDAYKESGDDGEYLYAMLFTSASKAKSYYNDHKKDINEEDVEDYTVKVSGKWIVAGTKAAVKAFTK